MTVDSAVPAVKPKRSAPEPDATITVVAWHDKVVEAHADSHATSSIETLMWWTPILGPTATLMAHRFAGYVARGAEVQFSYGDLARTLGMGSSTSRARAALDRLVRFRIVAMVGDVVHVRTMLPPLTRRQLAQLPPYLAELYEHRPRPVPVAVAG